MKKRRKRLRVDRILYCLIIFVALIFLIIFGIYSIKNAIIYNSLKKGNTVTINKKEIKVWKKTIDYVNKNMDTVTIKHKRNYITINSDKFKNGLQLKTNMYKKYIDEALFDNVKSYYVENKNVIKESNKIRIKLPSYLKRKQVVDVYGVKGKEIELYEREITVTDKYILFKTNNKYDAYFICYIKPKSISSSNNINIEVDEERDLNISINPSNSTSKKLIYDYDKKIISLENGVIKGLKKGSTTIKVKTKYEKVTKEINVTVKNKPKETIKEEKKEVKQKKYVVKNVDGITYVDGIMIVNKTYSLPSTYNPGGLTDEFMNAFYEMQAAAKLDNINLFVASGFRSYDYQVGLYEKYVEEDGKDAADRYSARPGYSEHQTGLAADINSADSSFEDTPEAIWLDENCYKYGFVIRFPKGKEMYTGYKYEPWHLRYVGVDIATKIHNAGDNVSLEEYYGLTSVYKD